MSSLAVFNFKSIEVRTIECEGKIWFAGSDICAVLGYKNTSKTISDHCKVGGITKRYTLVNGVDQELTYINEPNLYRLIIKSRKPEAESFESWVMEEVLPSIRKTGSYTLTINTEQQQAIKEAVNQRVHRTGKHYQTVYHEFYDVFKIPRYQELPAMRFNEAIAWLNDGFAPKQASAIDQVLSMIYDVCFDAIKNNADGMEMLRVLRKLPFTDPDVNHYMIKQLWDANNSIQALAEKLNLRSARGLPLMPNNRVLNMPNGGHISFGVQVRT